MPRKNTENDSNIKKGSLSSHDSDIREPLFDYLEERYGKIRILEEKRTGRARADVVMVTPDAIYGIEIKSDNDNYTRLEGQVKNYDLYYDYNIVAVGSTHGLHIREHVPEWWGVITIEEMNGTLDFYMLREAQKNPNVKDGRKISISFTKPASRLQKRRLTDKSCISLTNIQFSIYKAAFRPTNLHLGLQLRDFVSLSVWTIWGLLYGRRPLP